MKKGIFYNSKKAQCSIYESGLMCYNALVKSNKYILDYTEDTYLKHEYDFCIYNHRPVVNDWITINDITCYKKEVYCIVLEVDIGNDIMPMTPRIFTKYLVIDPTIKESHDIFSFPRPIEDFKIEEYKETEIPTIGSFGFVNCGKNWIQMVNLVQEEFDHAIIKINTPISKYTPNSELITSKLHLDLNAMTKKPGIKLELSSEYMDKTNLIKWCSRNTINYFPYFRDCSGLAATIDQAISAGRPILTTNNKTFRHVLQYIKPYPKITLKEAIKHNYEGVLKMKELWSSDNFYKKFETIGNF